MRIIRRLLELSSVILTVVLCMASLQAEAAGFDGSTPILCAITKSLGCDSDSGCEAATVESLNLPHFMRVDLKKNIATGADPAPMNGNQKITPIRTIQRMDGTIILQGIELRGWSAVIDEQTGKMTLTVSGDDEAFVLFGVCTAQ